jgi:hypothetical protein
MRRHAVVLGGAAALALSPVLAGPSSAAPRHDEDLVAHLHELKWGEPESEVVRGDPGAGSGNTSTGGAFSPQQIARFTCSSSGDPSVSVDMSCNDPTYGQDWNPDNEISVVVDPADPNHLLAGSNDYYYRFNNATGARQALVPTGFFTSFDGGKTWLDGQVPMRSGNGAGDPAPAFDRKHGVALMAQLENTAGLSGAVVANGDVTVSRSTDGGRTWERPARAINGKGAGIGPATNATFIDKEWITVDNNVGSPHYGRAYVTATVFLNGKQGSYAESPIVLSYSDDGGLTWSMPKEISGSSPTCTFQTTGPANQCDEDQASVPEVASDGTLYVNFLNEQNSAQWEVPFDFDNQVMVVRSTDGGQTFTDPVPVAQLEDGLSDAPYDVIGRQTVWGHQFRWWAAGTITSDPTDPQHVTVVWADRGTPNPNATEGCFYAAPGDAPNYDPCNAGPSSDVDIWRADSTDGGATWSSRERVSTGTAQVQEWFPWADYTPGGQLAVGWDRDNTPSTGSPIPANDTFNHVLRVGTGGVQVLSPNTAEGRSGVENPDVSLTHWAGQYVPQAAWPTVCGPAGTDTAGKDCSVFIGDYTGLAVGSDGAVNVVWTGMNRWETSPQVDRYTGAPHQGYTQDAMFARR